MSEPDPKPIPAPTEEDLRLDIPAFYNCSYNPATEEEFRGFLRRCFAAERERDAALERVKELEAFEHCPCYAMTFEHGRTIVYCGVHKPIQFDSGGGPR